MSNDKATVAVAALADALAQHGLSGTQLAVILGSGFGGFADRLENARTLESSEFAGMPRSTVAGHAGRLIAGELRGVRVLLQQGRVHLYEGRSVHDVTRFVRAIATLGCRVVVLTNAAGGLNRTWPIGSLMRVTDHINLQGETPLHARERGFGTPYDTELGAALARGAADARIDLREGVYAGLRGPSYETPAEIRELARIGASAVGMSTVAEALAAHAAGARVAAISCITNYAAGISDGLLAHEDVLEVGRRAVIEFSELLACSIPYLMTAQRP